MELGTFSPLHVAWGDALARIAFAILFALSIGIDPAKVISGVMSGIGFLGAGALFREGDIVKGAGLAASIWSAGAIGLICGMGFVWLAGLVAIGIILLLMFARRFIDTNTYTASSANNHSDVSAS